MFSGLIYKLLVVSLDFILFFPPSLKPSKVSNKLWGLFTAVGGVANWS